MTTEQYQEYLERIQAGQVIYHNGRTAGSADELAWLFDVCQAAETAPDTETPEGAPEPPSRQRRAKNADVSGGEQADPNTPADPNATDPNATDPNAQAEQGQ